MPRHCLPIKLVDIFVDYLLLSETFGDWLGIAYALCSHCLRIQYYLTQIRANGENILCLTPSAFSGTQGVSQGFRPLFPLPRRKAIYRVRKVDGLGSCTALRREIVTCPRWHNVLSMAAHAHWFNLDALVVTLFLVSSKLDTKTCICEAFDSFWYKLV